MHGRAQTRGRAVAGRAKWAAPVAIACLLAAPLRAQSAPPLRAQSAPPLQAQGAPPPDRGTPFGIKWGKWAAAAAAVGFTALGVRQHNAGDAAFTDLINYCRTNVCTLTPAGRYADPQAESRYQRVVRDDRSARAWLIGGQVAAIGSAVLWVLQLRSAREPANIPYSGLVVATDARGARLGWRIAF